MEGDLNSDGVCTPSLSFLTLNYGHNPTTPFPQKQFVTPPPEGEGEGDLKIKIGTQKKFANKFELSNTKATSLLTLKALVSSC